MERALQKIQDIKALTNESSGLLTRKGKWSFCNGQYIKDSDVNLTKTLSLVTLRKRPFRACLLHYSWRKLGVPDSSAKKKNIYKLSFVFPQCKCLGTMQTANNCYVRRAETCCASDQSQLRRKPYVSASSIHLRSIISHHIPRFIYYTFPRRW